MNRDDAVALDQADPLAPLRDLFDLSLPVQSRVDEILQIEGGV